MMSYSSTIALVNGHSIHWWFTILFFPPKLGHAARKIGTDLEPSAGEQVLDFGSAAFSLGWSVKRRVLAVGGNSELRLYTV